MCHVVILAVQLRTEGLHEKAEQIEQMLGELKPSRVTDDQRSTQVQEARAFAEKVS